MNIEHTHIFEIHRVLAYNMVKLGPFKTQQTHILLRISLERAQRIAALLLIAFYFWCVQLEVLWRVIILVRIVILVLLSICAGNMHILYATTIYRARATELA